MAEFEELKRLPFIIDQLEAIQELHKPVESDRYGLECRACSNDFTYVSYPCPTRKLADEALGGGELG